MKKKGRPQKWETSLHQLLTKMKREDYSFNYIRMLNGYIRDFFNTTEIRDPIDVNENDIRDFLNNSTLKTKSKKLIRTCMTKYFSYCGNHIMKDIKFRDPIDESIKRDWLDKDQIFLLETADINPQKRMIVHLGLHLACRIDEIRNIILSRIQPPYIEILGKRRKTRTVPFDDSTQDTIDKWMILREKWLKGRKSPYLIIGQFSLNPCVRTLHGIVGQIRDQCGVTFTNHTLRRTWGRTAWENKVPIESISKVLGHQSIDTTLIYIGINLDHMEDAMNTTHSYYSSVVEEGLNRENR